MTENELTRINDLFRELQEEKQYEGTIKLNLDNDTSMLCRYVADSIRDCEDEKNGKRMKMSRPIDKLFYDNREIIRQTIVSIMEKELDKIRVHKESLEKEINNVEVKF